MTGQPGEKYYPIISKQGFSYKRYAAENCNYYRAIRFGQNIYCPLSAGAFSKFGIFHFCHYKGTKGAGSAWQGVLFFVKEDFEQKIAEGAFLEWEMVYKGKYYGTLKSEIDRMWQEGKIPLLDIDVHGAMHVQKCFPEVALAFL
jgi:hypothetical protein